MIQILLALACQTPGAEIDSQIAQLQVQVATLTSSVATLEGRDARDPALYADDFIPEGGDLADAFDALQVSGRCDLGCTVRLGAREYAPSRPLTLCRQMRVVGTSGWGPAAGTVVNTSTTVGLRVAFQSTCSALGLGRDGRHSSIEHIAFRTTLPWQTTSVGILLEARAKVREVWVRDFTHGIRIEGGVARTGGPDAGGIELGAATNANLWSLEHVRTDLNHHAGVWVDGPDANAGTAIGVDSASNCVHGDAYADEYGPCYEIVEGSFLGNTWIQIHAAMAFQSQGAVRTDQSANSRSVFLGSYFEGAATGLEGPNDLVLGGIGNFEGGAVDIADGAISGFCTADTLGLGEMCFGDRAGTGLVSFRGTSAPFNPSRAIRLSPFLKAGEPYFKLEGQNSGALRIGQLNASDMIWEQVSDSVLPVCPTEGAQPVNNGVVGVLTSSAGLSLCGFE